MLTVNAFNALSFLFSMQCSFNHVLSHLDAKQASWNFGIEDYNNLGTSKLSRGTVKRGCFSYCTYIGFTV